MANFETVPGFRDMFRCPVCKSVDLEEIAQPVIDKTRFCYVVGCASCHVEFHQIFELQRVEIEREQ